MAHTADLLYSDTERTLAAALADLLSSRAQASDVLARTEKPDTYDLDLWRTVAAEIGLAGLLIPEPLGGAGASYRELAAAAEQFGAAVAPIPYLGSAAVATAVLLSAAKSSAQRTEPQPVSPAADLLRRMADGELTAALAVPAATLPGGAFPSAVRVAGSAGEGMTKLSGTIPAVPDALPADVLLVPAEGVPNALYLVEASAPGVHRTPVVSLDMTRQLCDVSLDGAPARQVAVGQAAEAAADAGLLAGAAIVAAEELGLAQRCLDMTVAYLKERHQFARQIGSFQALKHRLADLWTMITQARAASRYAAACLADGDPDAPVAVALAKSACGEAAVAAAQECVQMHGGIGFTWEHPAHLYLKRAKASSVLFGTPGAHRAALATLVNLPGPGALSGRLPAARRVRGSASAGRGPLSRNRLRRRPGGALGRDLSLAGVRCDAAATRRHVYPTGHRPRKLGHLPEPGIRPGRVDHHHGKPERQEDNRNDNDRPDSGR